MGYVYQILNKNTQKVYIGSTKDYKNRKQTHLLNLRKDSHVNSHLQRSFNKHGEHSFEFSVLLECEDYLEREQEIIDSSDWDNLYNMSKCVSGGDKLSYHPNREAIVDRIRVKMNELHSLEGDENPWRNRDVKGENNPNWNGWSSITYCTCGNEMASTAKTCSSCQDRTGENNPFYGKHHNDETKAKISAVHKGKEPLNNIEVVIDGVEYQSFTDAGRKLDVHTTVVHHRCTKSTNPKFKDWVVKGVIKEVKEVKAGYNAIPVLCEGKLFATCSEAAQYYNLSMCAIQNRVKSKNYPEFIKVLPDE